jgi:hypothetical protein
MATNNSNNQSFANNADGFTLGGGTTNRNLQVSGGDILIKSDASSYQYYEPNASTQDGIKPTYQLITLTAAYTTANNTTFKKMFDTPTNGTLTAVGNTTYFFECCFSLSGLATNATTNAVNFGFLGTATYTRVRYWALAVKAAVTPTGVFITLGTAATATALTNATSTPATFQARIRGKIVIGTTGTIIPAFSTQRAAAAIVGADSYCKIWEAGSNTLQSIGNWS